MKKLLILFVVLLISTTSFSQENPYVLYSSVQEVGIKISGKWNIKTIEDFSIISVNGNSIKVDSEIFHCNPKTVEKDFGNVTEGSFISLKYKSQDIKGNKVTIAIVKYISNNQKLVILLYDNLYIKYLID